MKRTHPDGPIDIAFQFVEHINRQNLDALVDLMSVDHTFIDLAGDVHQGRDVMREGWAQYFAMCPNYMIHLAAFHKIHTRVLLIGRTTGSHLGLPRAKEFQETLIWSATVEDEKVSTWQIFDDTTETRHMLGLT